MKITAINTIWIEEYPNICWVQIETDSGLSGLGETYFGPEAVAAYIHETVIPYLLGKNPLMINQHSQALDGLIGFHSTGVEMRANSAINIGLWDIFGKYTELPIYQLLGGKMREKIQVYNTCAGYSYNSKKTSPNFNLHNNDDLKKVWGINKKTFGIYEDIDAFHNRPGELAKSLLSEGITAMKIWPFDQFAETYNGQWITPQDLQTGVNIFKEIRDTVGDKIEIILEMHGKWSLPAAKYIANAIDPYRPLWYEDPIKPDNIDTLIEFSRSTKTPTALSELLATRRQFVPILQEKVAGFLIVDITWCGGISEAIKIADLAETYHIPITAHDCTGPISLVVNSHFSVNMPNAFIAEFVRAYYSTWYKDLVTELPLVKDGWLYPIDKPGLGTELSPEIFNRKDIHIQKTAL